MHQQHLLRDKHPIQQPNKGLPQLVDEDNPEHLKAEKRNLSLVLPKTKKTVSKDRKEQYMIKSNGFSFYLPEGSPKGNKITPLINPALTARYDRPNNLHYSHNNYLNNNISSEISSSLRKNQE